jgi:hypothetical protein
MRFSLGAAAMEAHSSSSATADQYRSPVSLSIRFEKAKQGGSGGLYLVTEKFAHGHEISYPLVYDPDAFRSPEAARRAFDAHHKGYALDRSESGMYVYF